MKIYVIIIYSHLHSYAELSWNCLRRHVIGPQHTQRALLHSMLLSSPLTNCMGLETRGARKMCHSEKLWTPW